MHRIRQQDGITTHTILLSLLSIGLAVFFIFKLFPPYYEYYGVVSSLRSMANESGMHAKSKAEIMRLLRKRLGINDVRRVEKEDITIQRQKKSTLLNIAYEVQIPLLFNVDLLLTFDNSVTLY